MLDLNKLKQQSYNISKQREAKEPKLKTTTMELLKYCAGEVIEAQEAYTRYVFSSYQEPDDFPAELADIINCVLIIAGLENIDIEDALIKCIEKNELRAKS